MKKLILIIILIFPIAKILKSQTYQLPNGGFELWDGNGNNDEPAYWNGFPSAACNIAIGCNMATATRHSRSTDIRPGSTGSYSCKIFATEINILGSSIIANGNITTGQIRIGSTTASNSENYNITRTSNSQFRQELNSMPDSIRFWVKFQCPSSTQEARVNAVIHDNYDYRDPQGSDPNARDHIVGRATMNFTRGTQTWIQYSAPFVYDNTYYPATTPSYILLTFTTNKEPGKGSANDILYIDDIELVYNSNLKEIIVNGNKINDFNPQTTDYYVDMDCNAVPEISFTTASPNATANIHKSAEDNTLYTISVINGDQQKDYNIHLYSYEYITDEICEGESYNKNGFDLPVMEKTGIYKFTRPIPDAPCESLLQLNLTVNPSYPTAIPFELMICENFTYDFFGQLINTPGIYTEKLSTEKGCDSLVVLDLSIGDRFEYTINASICDGETYNQNGFNESQKGLYSRKYQSSYSCDSIVNLNLTVNNSYYREIFDTIFKGEHYIKNGFNIDDTNDIGTITEHLNFLTGFGCDSIITLNLTVKEYKIEYPPTSSDFQFKIYPNPANDKFKIDIEDYFAGDLRYYIYTTYGSLIQSGYIPHNNYDINIQNIEKGIYILKIFLSEEFYKSTKLVIF